MRTDEVYDGLSWFSSEQVSQANIMVVGCGALGNEVLKNLALFGIEHFVVVDFDHVEPSNLSRSILFSQKDARQGRRKTEAVAASIRNIRPSADIQTIFGDVSYDVGLGWFRHVDVVIGCVDNRWARYQINRHCMRTGTPWVDGGIDRLEGTVRVFRPGENCYACNLGPEGLKDLAWRMPCSGIVRRNEAAGRAATTPVIASVIGAVEVQEALKIIHTVNSSSQSSGTDGTSDFTSLCGRVFYYEGQHLTTKTARFKAYDDDCPVHDLWQPVLTSDITTDWTVNAALGHVGKLLGEPHPQISLKDCFVDTVSSRTDDRQVSVMKPGRAVADYLEQHTQLKGCLLSSLYQHEYTVLDDRFPYQELTLAEVGIPSWDILQVNERYVEMRKEH